MTIFEKIIKKEIKSDILYEDDKIIAIKDINPIREGHFLVIPKVHSENLIDIEEDIFIYLMLKAKEIAKQVIQEMNVSGFNLQINNGKEAGQEVPYTHIHIIPSSK